MEFPSVGDPLRDSWWPYIIALAVGIVTCIKSYMGGEECPSKQRIDGKVVIITGAYSGIGLEMTIELARRGGLIVLACRDVEKGNTVRLQIIEKIPDAKIEVRHIDVSLLKSVKAFVEDLEYEQVDILINNAGVVFCPYELTSEGFETHFVTNYLGHFLLTHLLLPRLKASPNGHVINVSAQAHYVSTLKLEDLNLSSIYVAREAFGQSKLALILMARHMATLLKGSNVRINAFHPGIVRGTQHMGRSPLANSYMIQISMLPWLWLLTKTPIQGAQTAIYLAVSSDVANVSGKFFGECEIKEPSATAKDNALAAALYKKSCQLAGIDELQPVAL